MAAMMLLLFDGYKLIPWAIARFCKIYC